MKKPRRGRPSSEHLPKHPAKNAVPMRRLLLMEGLLMTHGTRGKETRGPRGNKKY